MEDGRSEEIGCSFCDWTLDQTPWISGRRANWPRPIAHLLFLRHRNRLHRDEYRVWKQRWTEDELARVRERARRRHAEVQRLFE